MAFDRFVEELRHDRPRGRGVVLEHEALAELSGVTLELLGVVVEVDRVGLDLRRGAPL